MRKRSNPVRDPATGEITKPLVSPARMAAAAARVEFLDQIPEKGIIPLYPYQRRWIADKSRFALWLKSVQIGASFAEAVRIIQDKVSRPVLHVYLSAKEDLTKEFVRTAKRISQAAGIVAELYENEFFRSGNTDYLVQRIEWPSGGRLIGLAANPETAVSYTGDVTWDETARTPNDEEIMKALLGRVSRGFTMRQISNPKGERGVFWKIAKMLGLANGILPARQPVKTNGWSGHMTDIYMAVREGCPIDIEELKAGYVGDEDGWIENHCCIFLSAVTDFFPLDVIQPCVSDQASLEFEPKPGMILSLGADIGRRRDLFVKTIVEEVGDVQWTRRIRSLAKARFKNQKAEILDDAPLCRHGCMDATGMGEQNAEECCEKYPGILEGVLFTAQVKHTLVSIAKEHFEDHTVRIPDFEPLKLSIRAIKKMLTPAGNWIFDAERSDKTGHADYAWSLFLALMAAKTGIAAASVGADVGRGELLAQQREARPSFWREEKSADYAEKVPAGARGITRDINIPGVTGMEALFR